MLLTNYIAKTKFFIYKVLIDLKYSTIILADEKFPIQERLVSFVKLISMSAPVAFVMSLLNQWFTDNKEFSTFVIGAVLINMGVGVWRHARSIDFSPIVLLKKTGLMIAVLLITYVALEMVLIVARKNMITDAFRIVLQVATLMYPLSKVFKNIYILSNGEYPPEWLMKKIYNFNKNGDLKDFLSSGNDINNNEENIQENDNI